MWKSLLILAALCCSSLLPSEAVPIQLHGLNYNTRQGPDWDWDKCKSHTQILKELTLLSRITNRVRLLSLTDCYQGSMVLEVVKELGMQMWLGLWVGLDEGVFQWELSELKSLLSRGLIDTDTVLGISVGSEAIYREDATVDQMIDNLNQVYAAILEAGLDIPVSIVDVAPEYSKSAKLRSAVNVTMTNTFPFWEGIDIDGAVDDLQEDLDWILQLPESSGKPFVLGETGWPSDGYIEGVGIAGPDLQRQYFAECFCRLEVDNGWEYYWFTGIDNSWRQEQDPENTIEGNWGLLYSNLTLKPQFEDLSFECSNGVEYSFAEVDWSIPGVTAPPVALDPASCAAHSDCEGLFGDCCPNGDGLYLGCCDMDLVDIPPTASPVTVTGAPATLAPSFRPTPSPSKGPTKSPTQRPTHPPATAQFPDTELPTGFPTSFPTSFPTESPSQTPNDTPSTSSPTSATSPTGSVTPAPVVAPTPKPTVQVIVRPTASTPTNNPTVEDDDVSFRSPTRQPATSEPTSSTGGNLPGAINTGDSGVRTQGSTILCLCSLVVLLLLR